MNKTQIKRIVQDMPGTMQTSIMERYMTAGEIKAFWSEYRKNRQRMTSKSRFTNFRTEISPKEMGVLKAYLFDESKTTKDVMKESGMSTAKILYIGMRALYQGIKVK